MGERFGVQVTSPRPGTVKIEYPSDITVTVESKKKELGYRKKNPPKGAIEALLPVFQEAYSVYPNVLPPEPGFFEELKRQTKYDEETAVNLLRRHEFSVKETSSLVMEMLLGLSGVVGKDKERAELLLGDWIENQIHDLYIETTSSTTDKVK